MKKFVWLLIVCLLLAGCSKKTEDLLAEPPEPTLAPGYQNILDAYTEAIRDGWDGQRMMDAGLNFMVVQGGFADPGKDLGYAVVDLDGDGREELLIGTRVTDEFSGKMILSCYVLEDGEAPRLLFESWERNRFYYAGENRFANVGSSAWDDSFQTTLTWENGSFADLAYTTAPEDYVQLELIPFEE